MSDVNIVFAEVVVCEKKAQENGAGSLTFVIGKTEVVKPSPDAPPVRVANDTLTIRFGNEPARADSFTYKKKYKVTIEEVTEEEAKSAE